MKRELTPFHTVIVNHIGYDCTSGNWYCEYVIFDSILKSEKKESLVLDRHIGGIKDSPEFAFEHLIEHLKFTLKIK